MPRNKINNNKVKEDILLLRRQGKTYNQIAEQLGCQVYNILSLR